MQNGNCPQSLNQGTTSVSSTAVRSPNTEIASARDAYNDGYTHEALHTVHVLLDTWDQHVVETRCADEFPDVKEAADKAVTAMHAVYQLIGRKFVDDPAANIVGDNLTGASSTDPVNCPQSSFDARREEIIRECASVAASHSPADWSAEGMRAGIRAAILALCADTPLSGDAGSLAIACIRRLAQCNIDNPGQREMAGDDILSTLQKIEALTRPDRNPTGNIEEGQ